MSGLCINTCEPEDERSVSLSEGLFSCVGESHPHSQQEDNMGRGSTGCSV